MIRLTQTAAGVTFRVRVTPRAGRTAVAGERGEALAVKLAAAPVDGAANDALIAMLATLLGRPKRDVSIVSGDRSRDKVVEVRGISVEDGAARLTVRPRVATETSASASEPSDPRARTRHPRTLNPREARSGSGKR